MKADDTSLATDIDDEEGMIYLNDNVLSISGTNRT